eukprot:365457-Chlamydomonas_euryale.AAC.1
MHAQRGHGSNRAKDIYTGVLAKVPRQLEQQGSTDRAPHTPQQPPNLTESSSTCARSTKDAPGQRRSQTRTQAHTCNA